MKIHEPQELSLAEAVRLYAEALESQHEESIKKLEWYFYKEYGASTPSNVEKLHAAIQAVQAKKLPKRLKNDLIQIKLFVFEIIMSLDLTDITNLAQIQMILLKISKKLPQSLKIRKSIAKTIKQMGESEIVINERVA